MKIDFKKLACVLLSLFALSDANSFACDETSTLRLFESRYSGYEYDVSKQVVPQQIRTILSAGRLAPSSYNEQPWRFIVCDRNQNRQAYEKALGCLVEENKDWAKNAPVLIICLSDIQSAYTQKKNDWAEYDTGAASMSLMLQAASMGLMAHQMGGFDSDKVKKEFSIPENVVPMSIMSIGYSAGEPKLKNRKPLGENFFLGEWGCSVE